MTSKDESIFTQERILSISGSKACCVKCLSMVIAKLAEDGDLSQFQNRGTTYVTNQGTGFDSRNSAVGRGRTVRVAVGNQKTTRNGSLNGCKNLNYFVSFFALLHFFLSKLICIMLSSVMQCVLFRFINFMLCSAILCSAVLCHAMPSLTCPLLCFSPSYFIFPTNSPPAHSILPSPLLPFYLLPFPPVIRNNLSP